MEVLAEPFLPKKKLAEWREALATTSGKFVVAGEIIAAVAIWIILSLWLILVALAAAR